MTCDCIGYWEQDKCMGTCHQSAGLSAWLPEKEPTENFFLGPPDQEAEPLGFPYCNYCNECQDCDCKTILLAKFEDPKWRCFYIETRSNCEEHRKTEATADMATYHFSLKDKWQATAIAMAVELASYVDSEYSNCYVRTLVPLSDVLGVEKDLMREYAIATQGVSNSYRNVEG